MSPVPVAIAALFLVSALLAPLAMPSVVTASVTQTESSPLPWGSATPTLLISPLTGETHAVWVEREGYTKIRHSVEATASDWTYETYPVAYGDAPDVEFTQDGVLHIVFENQFMGNWEIYYVKLTPGAERWSLPINGAYTLGESRNPRMTTVPDGVVRIVWQDNTPGYWTIYRGEQCGAELQFFCNRPIPSGRGFGPDILGDWIVWQDTPSWEGGNLILLQHQGESVSWIVNETVQSFDGPRILPGGGVRIRWSDADGADWFCDAWSDPEGRILLGYVLPWKDFRIFLPSVIK